MMKKLVGGLAALLFSASAAIAQPLSGTLVFEYQRYANITTSTTTVVKSRPGLLGVICVNKAGASSNTATVYDNTAGSGTTIALIDATVVGCKTYNVQFLTGLTIVTATGTQADITVGYR